MTTRTVLGLDISSTNIGWCLLKGNKKLDDGTIRKKKGEELTRFLMRAADLLNGEIHEVGSLQAIAYEVNHSPTPACRRKAMTMVWRAIGGLLALMGSPDLEIPIHANNKKKEQRRHDLTLIYGEMGSEHVVDAVSVAHQALAKMVGL